MALLEAVGLSKSFTTKRDIVGRVKERNDAVKEVSLEVSEGETLAIVGESGAGKSTLGRLLLRLIEPDEGELRLQDVDLLALNRRELRAARRRMQMIFQNPYSSLDPRRVIGDAVGDAVTLHRGLHGAERKEAVRQLLASVGMREDQLDRYPYEFSGGQLQRVAIAHALAPEPALIVCDEPVAALDVSIRAQVVNLLHEIQDRTGVAYVFISHDLALVQLIAHRIAVVYKGRVVETGDAATVFADPQHPYTEALLSVIPMPDPRKRKRGVSVVPGAVAGRVDGAGARCEYASRCPEAIDICVTTTPELIDHPNGTRVACHMRS